MTGTINETVSRRVKTSNSFSNDYQPVNILDSFSSINEAPVTRQMRSVQLVSESELEGTTILIEFSVHFANKNS